MSLGGVDSVFNSISAKYKVPLSGGRDFPWREKCKVRRKLYQAWWLFFSGGRLTVR